MRMQTCGFFFFAALFSLCGHVPAFGGSPGAWWSSSEPAMICSLCPPSPPLLTPLPSAYSSIWLQMLLLHMTCVIQR